MIQGAYFTIASLHCSGSCTGDLVVKIGVRRFSKGCKSDSMVL